MGLIAELFVSDPEGACSYPDNSDAFRDRAQLKGFTSLELATLWELLGGGDFMDLMDQMPDLLNAGDGGPWIFELPPAYLMTLTTTPADALRAANAKWADTEELMVDPSLSWPVVEALVNLASRALASNRRLYLFNSL